LGRGGGGHVEVTIQSFYESRHTHMVACPFGWFVCPPAVCASVVCRVGKTFCRVEKGAESGASVGLPRELNVCVCGLVL